MQLLVVIIIAAAAVIAVMFPLVRGRGSDSVFDEDEFAAAAPALAERSARLDAEVERYRAALRAGTICARCGQANPEDSRFCYECGERLAPARARRQREAAATV